MELIAVNGQLKCTINKEIEMGTRVKFRWNIYGLENSYLDQFTFTSDPQLPKTTSELSVQTINKNIIFLKVNSRKYINANLTRDLDSLYFSFSF